MIITIISVALVVFGVIAMIIGESQWGGEALFISGCIAVLIGGIALVICLGYLVSANINPKLQYEKDYIEYEILQEQVDNGNYGSTTLTEEIVAYNQKVTDYKARYDSPWIGWFYYDGCENLPFVEMRGKR